MSVKLNPDRQATPWSRPARAADRTCAVSSILSPWKNWPIMGQSETVGKAAAKLLLRG